MKEKIKASAELIKQLTPLALFGAVIISLFTPLVVAYCKYVSVIWNLMF